VQRDLPLPIARPNVYVVDSPRYRRGDWNGEVWVAADPWGVPYAPYYKRPRVRFPVNTAVGAGIGAIVGHQRGRRHRGALIGGSIGLLFDLQRLWH